MSTNVSKYRPDIDGLRAIAVMAVVLDHLGTRLQGGYVGVDVFFVISGYLISAHMLAAMDAGSFSLVGFYERRVRRILPALLVMLLVTAVAAVHYLLPVELVGYARTLAAAVLSVSNIELWRESGYFAYGSELKPLLHTWSLGVEEQFYVFFPLFLLAVRRWWPRRLKAAIWTVMAVSLVAAVVWMRRDSTAVFFLSPFRTWELLLGTVLSQRYVPMPKETVQRNVAAAAGLGMIVVPVMLYSQSTVFPGLMAVPPCLGAVLVIAAGEPGSDGQPVSTWVGRLLSLRPMVFVGLISYSLYLWHWPVIVYVSRYALTGAGSPGPLGKLAYLTISMILGTLSWWLVERPFRQGQLRPGRQVLFALAGTVSVGALVLAGAFGLTRGLPQRFPPTVLAGAQSLRANPATEWRRGVCFLDYSDPFSNFNPKVCLPEDARRAEYLLVGDSHGAQMYPGLAQVMTQLNIGQATVGACVPLPGGVRPSAEIYRANCQRMADYLYREYLPRHRVHTVVYSGAWAAEDMPSLRSTAGYLAKLGVEMVVIGPNARYHMEVPRLLAAAITRDDPAMAQRNATPEPAALDRVMKAEVESWGVRYISYYDDMCADSSDDAQTRASSCPVYAAPGVPMLFDEHHLTVAGSVLFAEEMKRRGQLP